jgi:glyoxylate/hydroxypyruvate reductase
VTIESGERRILLSVSGWRPDSWLDAFRRVAPQREVVIAPASVRDPSIAYAVVWKPPPGSLAQLPNLMGIFSLGAGVDHVLNDPNLPDVPIVRIVSQDLTMRMSEFVVWQVLDQFRLGPRYRRQQLRRQWQELALPSASSVTVGIMGLGVLGADAASKLAPLGFRLAGWSRTEKIIAGVDSYHGDEGLGPFLARTDILVVLLPLTDATVGIIDSRLLDRLKRRTPMGGPVLINAGRGGLQVEADILAALDDGRLMAATLDVFQTEPLPADSPLWSHPRVTITPHAAATSDPDALVGPMVRQMENMEAGRPITGLVDRRRGY